jgi:hypothetical protein
MLTRPVHTPASEVQLTQQVTNLQERVKDLEIENADLKQLMVCVHLALVQIDEKLKEVIDNANQK